MKMLTPSEWFGGRCPENIGSDLNELGVAKALGVVQDRDHLRPDPDDRDAARRGLGHSLELRKLGKEQLAGVGKLETGPDVAKPPQAASHVTPEFEVYVSLAGLIDPAAEVKRLEKQLAEKKKSLQATEAKLNNENFTSRAPADVVQQQREQVAELGKQIAAIETNIRELQP